MRPYLVTSPDGEQVIVEDAASQSQALRVATDDWTVESLSAQRLLKLLKDNVPCISAAKATAEPESRV
jgi:hypothetical protein